LLKTETIPRFPHGNASASIPGSMMTERVQLMNFSGILLIAISVKLLISFVLYLKAKHVIAEMSLAKKGAVIGSSWLFSYGVFHFLEGII
jgi:hypothetical protein